MMEEIKDVGILEYDTITKILENLSRQPEFNTQPETVETNQSSYQNFQLHHCHSFYRTENSNDARLAPTTSYEHGYETNYEDVGNSNMYDPSDPSYEIDPLQQLEMLVREDTRKKKQVFISNISNETPESELHDLFAQFGTIDYFNIFTKGFKKFGFLCYKDRDVNPRALILDKFRLNNRPLVVRMDQQHKTNS